MERIFTDQMGRAVSLHFPPQRIISLVPSQTELLYDLGLHEKVVGQTLFCIHPREMHKLKPRVGGTKKLQMDKIAELKPDLIIGNKEENDQAQIEQLMHSYPVWMSDIRNLTQAIEMIRRVGELVGHAEQALQLALKIEDGFAHFQSAAGISTQTALYLIWRKPWMAAGADTFIDDMLKRCGFENAAAQLNSRYPELTDDAIRTLNPERILLSSEPYPFKAAHISELSKLCPQARIGLVDGELFSWYGSRLLKSVEYFKELRK